MRSHGRLGQAREPLALALVLAVAVAAGCGPVNAPPKQSASAKATEQATDPTDGWQYHESFDSFKKETTKLATVLSRNEFELGFPYQGAQRAMLWYRPDSDPQSIGAVLALSIEHGQFSCGQGCSIWIKINDDEPFSWKAKPLGDGSHMLSLSIRDYPPFLTACDIEMLLETKTLTVRAEFFQEGSRDMEFNVHGLRALPLPMASQPELDKACKSERAEQDRNEKETKKMIDRALRNATPH
jgi:hypothetical protein